jgi:hypothetical protein
MATKGEVERSYRKHFRALKNSGQAWNAVLEELAPAYSPEMPEAEWEKRREISDMIRKISKKIALEAGDPLEVAVHEAVRRLRADDAVGAAKASYKDLVEEAKKALEEDPTKEIVHPKPGPLEWRPGMVRTPRIEKRAKTLDEILEKTEGPYLYVMFDDEGGFEGWTIDYPQYWQGHGGPTAAVLVHDRLTYKEIESEIGETLAQSDIDWEKGEEEE